MRIALDTNVLAYALGVNDSERRAHAEKLVAELTEAEIVVPIQVLGELFRVLTRKARWTAEAARSSIKKWEAAVTLAPTTAAAFEAALDLAIDHRIPIWDAVILNVAAEAGCPLLLSEDFSEGFTWRGLTVVNPFAPARHPLLAAAVSG